VFFLIAFRSLPKNTVFEVLVFLNVSVETSRILITDR